MSAHTEQKIQNHASTIVAHQAHQARKHVLSSHFRHMHRVVLPRAREVPLVAHRANRDPLAMLHDRAVLHSEPEETVRPETGPTEGTRHEARLGGDGIFGPFVFVHPPIVRDLLQDDVAVGIGLPKDSVRCRFVTAVKHVHISVCMFIGW